MSTRHVNEGVLLGENSLEWYHVTGWKFSVYRQQNQYSHISDGNIPCMLATPVNKITKCNVAHFLQL